MNRITGHPFVILGVILFFAVTALVVFRLNTGAKIDPQKTRLITVGTVSPLTVDMPDIDIPGFAVGSWQVPRDMVAMSHKDEMILPADIANRFRSAAGSPSGPATPSANFARPSGGGGGGAIVVYQTFNFSRDAVRSDDDIPRMGVEMQERAQLLGFTGTVRQMGRATV